MWSNTGPLYVVWGLPKGSIEYTSQVLEEGSWLALETEEPGNDQCV